MLPQIRGGESSELEESSALPTPVSKRIGEKIRSENEIHSITGGHILRAGKQDPKELRKPKAAFGNATSSEVIVETIVTKEDKATKKILKRHKQIAKKLKVRIEFLKFYGVVSELEGSKVSACR